MTHFTKYFMKKICYKIPDSSLPLPVSSVVQQRNRTTELTKKMTVTTTVPNNP